MKCETYSWASLFHIFIKFRPEVLGNHGNFVRYHDSLMHTAIRLSLIQLISGNIQTNPGPKTVKPPKYPCGVCQKNVNSNQKAMECEDCLVWYHNKCVDMNNINFQVHVQHSSYVWVCFKCGLLDFTDSSLFVSFDVSNPFDVLDND